MKRTAAKATKRPRKRTPAKATKKAAVKRAPAKSVRKVARKAPAEAGEEGLGEGEEDGVIATGRRAICCC